jgi:uncharacterized repeat protein (TIGR02543 family)
MGKGKFIMKRTKKNIVALVLLLVVAMAASSAVLPVPAPGWGSESVESAAHGPADDLAVDTPPDSEKNEPPSENGSTAEDKGLDESGMEIAEGNDAPAGINALAKESTHNAGEFSSDGSGNAAPIASGTDKAAMKTAATGNEKIYTVGTGRDYLTPADAINDTGGIRANDGLKNSDPWVMELYDDFMIDKPLSIIGGKKITIRSAGTQHSIDAQNKSQVIAMNGVNTSLTLENVKITGGKGDDYGGGICVTNGATLAITGDSEVSGNNAGFAGGGICAFDGSTVTATGDSVISGNDSTYGGGIYSYHSTVKLSDYSKVSGNTSYSGGGGLYLSGGEVEISENAEISNNIVKSEGGGIYCEESVVTISGDSRISGNIATDGGGGISANMDCTLKMTGRSAVTGNRTLSYEGGGISVYKSTVTVSGNSKVNSNSADDDYGGGIFADESSVIELTENSVVSGNTAYSGGGIAVRNSSVEISGKSAVLGNAAARDGGGIYLPNGAVLTVPQGSEVTFGGNKADGLYGYDKGNPPTQTIVGTGNIGSISLANLNELNGFPVSTEEQIFEANRASIFNNYDIYSKSNKSLGTCDVKYLDEKGDKSVSPNRLLAIGSETGYVLEDELSGNDTDFCWFLHEKSANLNLTSAIGGEAINEKSLLAYRSPVKLNFDAASPSRAGSLTFYASPAWRITYIGLDGLAEPKPGPASYHAAATPVQIGDPVKQGYTFDGWTVAYANNNGANVATPTKGYMIPKDTTGSVVLTAHWSANNNPADKPGGGTVDNGNGTPGSNAKPIPPNTNVATNSNATGESKTGTGVGTDGVSSDGAPDMGKAHDTMPLSSPSYDGRGSWSVFNLLCAVLALAMAVASVIRLIIRRKDKGTVMAALSALLSVTIAAVFLLTQDIQGRAVLFDLWSIVFGVGIGFEAVFARLIFGNRLRERGGAAS